MITKERAIEIAKKNAKDYYKDLSIYEINATFFDTVWHVDFELKDAKLDGGGPHYVISAKDGKVIDFKFYQ